MKKTQMRVGIALQIASWLGDEYRVGPTGSDWSDPKERFRLTMEHDRIIYLNDLGEQRDFLIGTEGVIIRPSPAKTVSLIEALAWAREDESRVFRTQGGRVECRVRDNAPQYLAGIDWNIAGAVAWDAPCTIPYDEWESVTIQIEAVPTNIESGALAETKPPSIQSRPRLDRSPTAQKPRSA